MNCCKKGNNKEIKNKWGWIGVFLFVTFLLAVFVFKISLANIFFYAVLLICPLMHLFMMKGMDHGDKKLTIVIGI